MNAFFCAEMPNEKEQSMALRQEANVVVVVYLTGYPG